MKIPTYAVLLVIIGGVTVGGAFAIHSASNPFVGDVQISAGGGEDGDLIMVDGELNVQDGVVRTITNNELVGFGGDQFNPAIELRDDGVDGGTPYIIFFDDTSPTDIEARIILTSPKELSLEFADLRLAKLNPRIIPNGNLCIGSGCP